MIRKYIRAFRFAEVSMLTGFVFIGAVFSIRSFDSDTPFELFLIFCIAFCSISSLYAFNAYQGRKEDSMNQRLEDLAEIPSKAYLNFFVVSYLFSLVLGYYLNENLVFLLFILGVFGVAYSIPGIGKDRPFAGTLIHLFFQMTAFQIAYIVFQPISLNSLLISIYFSLLYMAGHFHHEVIDYEADRESALKTGAVHMGIAKTERWSFALFTVAGLYWVLLYWQQIIYQFELLPFLVAFIIHIVIFLRIHGRFEREAKKRIQYRTAYRLLYFVSGLTLLSIKYALIVH